MVTVVVMWVGLRGSRMRLVDHARERIQEVELAEHHKRELADHVAAIEHGALSTLRLRSSFVVLAFYLALCGMILASAGIGSWRASGVDLDLPTRFRLLRFTALAERWMPLGLTTLVFTFPIAMFLAGMATHFGQSSSGRWVYPLIPGLYLVAVVAYFAVRVQVLRRHAADPADVRIVFGRQAAKAFVMTTVWETLVFLLFFAVVFPPVLRVLDVSGDQRVASAVSELRESEAYRTLESEPSKANLLGKQFINSRIMGFSELHHIAYTIAEGFFVFGAMLAVFVLVFVIPFYLLVSWGLCRGLEWLLRRKLQGV
jgi:hypothetical protein